jgi:hypothetical protein
MKAHYNCGNIRLIGGKKLYVQLKVFIKVFKNKYNFSILSTNVNDQ